MADIVDRGDKYTKLSKEWVDAFKKENKIRRMKGEKAIPFDEYKKRIQDQKGYKKITVTNTTLKEAIKQMGKKPIAETAKVATKAAVKSALSPKKAFLAGTGVGGVAGVVGMAAYDAYKAVKKHKKKKRQESGTKHLGKKAYGGKVNTYRSPRRTTYND